MWERKREHSEASGTVGVTSLNVELRNYVISRITCVCVCVRVCACVCVLVCACACVCVCVCM